jgi:hypothetical protein
MKIERERERKIGVNEDERKMKSNIKIDKSQKR